MTSDVILIKADFVSNFRGLRLLNAMELTHNSPHIVPKVILHSIKVSIFRYIM